MFGHFSTLGMKELIISQCATTCSKILTKKQQQPPRKLFQCRRRTDTFPLGSLKNLFLSTGKKALNFPAIPEDLG